MQKIQCKFFLKKKKLFDCPMTNFRPLLRGQPHSPIVNMFNLKVTRNLNKVGTLGPTEHLVGFEPGTF